MKQRNFLTFWVSIVLRLAEALYGGVRRTIGELSLLSLHIYTAIYYTTYCSSLFTAHCAVHNLL